MDNYTVLIAFLLRHYQHTYIQQTYTYNRITHCHTFMFNSFGASPWIYVMFGSPLGFILLTVIIVVSLNGKK